MTAYFAYMQNSGAAPLAGVAGALLCEIAAPATARVSLRRIDARAPTSSSMQIAVSRTTTPGVAGRKGDLFAGGENIDYPQWSRTKLITDWKSPPVISAITVSRTAIANVAAAGPVTDFFWSRGFGIPAGGSLAVMLTGLTNSPYPSVFLCLEIEE